ncbi:MAG: alkaline phosphatase family protein [Planctomycetes bacterium]|nr:alkaline phosphatase family protein [Planctomycetota bacterium]
MVWTAITAAAWCVAGCTLPEAARLRLADGVEKPPRNVVIFFADGLDVQRLREILDAGLLPNIRRTFLEGGVEIRDAIAAMPAVTYPNCSTVVTGLYPGHHDILGNFWFDRDRLLVRCYMTLDTARDVNHDLRRTTLYDVLSDRLTVSLLAQTHRGVTASFDLKPDFDRAWILGRYLDADRAVGETFLDVVDLANRVRRWPTVLMTYYPAIDEIGHRQGPDSSEYAAALTHLDRTVGRVTAAMNTLGLSRSTYYALISDHGMAPIEPGQDFGLIRWLQAHRRMKVLNSPLREADYAGRYEAMQHYDAIATVDAGRVAMVHLRGRGWVHRPEPGEVRAWAKTPPAVHELPAVEMVASRAGPNRAAVWSRTGSLVVERRVQDERCLYRLAQYVGDPLLIKGEPRLSRFAGLSGADSGVGSERGWHDSREWLAATATSRYPDLVPQVVEMFDSPHTGDLVVFAADGWLLYPNEVAGHGSTLHRDMHVPMFFAGPDLPAGTQVPVGRLVDFMPTLLGLLSESRRLESFPPIDGIDLSDELRRAVAPPPEPLPPPTPPRRLER